MFGIGSTELLVILVVALIVLGPKSLAGVSRSLGKAMGEFRRMSTDFQRTLNAEAAEEDEEERRKQAAAKRAQVAEHVKKAKAARAEKAAAQAGGQATADAENTDSAEAGTEEATAGSAVSFEESQIPSPPADSPLAKALEKAKAEAAAEKQDKDGKGGTA